MPFQKGNKLGGRGTAREEAQKILNLDLANKIHNETLEGIANTPAIERKREDIKDFVIPVSLKGMVEKRENTILIPNPILSNVFSNHSDKKNNTDAEKDKGDTGRNIGEQDSVDNLIPNTPIAE